MNKKVLNVQYYIIIGLGRFRVHSIWFRFDSECYDLLLFLFVSIKQRSISVFKKIILTLQIPYKFNLGPNLEQNFREIHFYLSKK